MLFSLLILIAIIVLLYTSKSTSTTISTSSNVSDIVGSPISYSGDFSCQPSECEDQIKTGINNTPYPGCNSLVQINETGASNPKACDYWKVQQAYFGTEDYVDLSALSKEGKSSRGEKIIDGFLGMDVDIEVHRNAASAFLKAEEDFNKQYGSTRQGSTYFLPSYPSGYTFEFSGSINKRAIRGSSSNTDGLLYEGEYITPSNHFWGVAIDLNSSTNKGNRETPGQCSIDIPPEIVKVFESSGLRWGGRYFNDGDLKNYMDPMHFEYVPGCIRPN